MSRAPGSLPPLDRGIFFVHLSRARKHVSEDRFDLARQELELAQLAKPNDEEVLNLLSVVEFKRGYYNEAAQAARQLMTANPNSAVLHCNLGLILFKAGVLGEAEQELRRAVELKPDHARSHLYLGLLYRMRGKLGLAVEHLKYAGANKVVSEIEETLRRSPRDGGRGAATARTLPAEPPPVAPVIPISAADMLSDTDPLGKTPPEILERPTQPNEAARPAEAVAETTERIVMGEIPGPISPEAPAEPTMTPEPMPLMEPPLPTPSFSRETSPDPRPGLTPRDTDGRPLFHVRPDGGLEIASRGVVFVRKGSVVWYSGKIRFAPEPSFRGTRLERILRADGRGYLFVNDPGRSAFRRDLSGQSLYLEGGRLLALDHGLSFRLEPIHDFRMNRRVDILKIQGRGSVILSVGGPLLAHEVSPEYPLNVSSRDLVAWTGDLVPSVLEDRFLEEVMMPDVGSAPKIRFEGTGTVLTEPPRPRRRATDLARPSEADRRA
jgi:Flp pilus assembly protein TadD/uncharacterized protein (AIM24 family)